MKLNELNSFPWLYKKPQKNRLVRFFLYLSTVTVSAIPPNTTTSPSNHPNPLLVILIGVAVLFLWWFRKGWGGVRRVP